MSNTPVVQPADSAASSGGKFRWVVCSLLFSSVAINYIDRLVLSILKKDLCHDLGWSDIDYGNIAAAFSFAYAFGYLFGGRLIDRLGVKRGLPMFVLFWSIAATAHGLCGLIGVDSKLALQYPWFSWAEKGFIWMTLSLPMTAAGFVLARIALGLTEGGNFPGAIKAVAEWYPLKERALATGWFNVGTNFGAVLCPIIVPWMYKLVGWQATFYITGATGFVWVVVWWYMYDTPEKHKKLSAAERDYIRQGQPPVVAVQGKAPKVSWLSLLRFRAVWAYVLASVLAGPAWGFYQFFVPDFLDKKFHMETQTVGWWTGAFFALAAVGGVAGGWLAGKLMGKGWTLNAARKTTMLICAICVVPVCLAPFAGSVLIAVLILGLAGSAHQGWSANLFSVVSDTMPKEAISSVVGLGGFVSYFASGLVSSVTGIILQKTGSYVSVFGYFAGMYVLSLIIIQLLVPRIGQAVRSS